MNFRIGQGYDVHKLAEGYKLTIGGIEINHTKGCIAHSDGDVLIHAICDALLGAANLRDIGYHFPDTNTEYKNIDSKILLNKTHEIIKKQNFSIINIDSTICLQKPKLKDHIPIMKNTLSNALNINIDKISIKATTTEKLGFVGEEKGISAQA
ncbi:MAG: 2-C-methyl-D-erythritol 2,4-cyclodiphosphate synthase, partial [Bacteroidota bacterium]|nr:2-C-methyl-D-erythritol 2,4-cyclodiphosphate synthase [Bacteroidota bacterium]